VKASVTDNGNYILECLTILDILDPFNRFKEKSIDGIVGVVKMDYSANVLADVLYCLLATKDALKR